MALSKSQKIIILLVIDSLFFLLELISGYAVHSLALVADSFHMLNDVLSLCVGLWAVKMANRETAPKMYTYGYQRAETLGALVNGVFLVALCVTIFLDAIQRFVEPQVVSNPKLVLIVGCLGLASNILGLALFHDHGGHGHSHGGHSHGGHSHSHGDEVSHAEEGHFGHTHSHDAGQIAKHSHAHPEVVKPADASGKTGRVTISDDAHRRSETVGSDSTAVDDNAPRSRSHRRHSRSLSKSVNLPEDFQGPTQFRNSIIALARNGTHDEDEDDEVEEEGDITESAVADEHEHSHDVDNAKQPLLSGAQGNNYGTAHRKSVDHAQHKHSQSKAAGSQGGHSHGDLNMRGIFLHVMGDALGNIGVIATALIIWLTKYSWRYYFDPAISLVITIIILCSAIPLCTAASRILLQAVPQGIEVDDIQDDILKLDGVESAHHLHVWQLSDTKLVASLHVKVRSDFEHGTEGSKKYMRLAESIRECLHEYGIHSSTIQPEFCHGREDGHDHDALESTNGETLAGSSSAAASDAGQQCLLECGEQCGGSGQMCCPPTKAVTTVNATADSAHDGHGHDGHSH